MTAIADRPPAEEEVAVPLTLVAAGPVATLCADLMPDEIVVKRRLAYLKRRLVFVMAALVALVVLGDMLVRQQTGSAQSNLSAANNHIATLNQQLNRFNGMLATQSETQAIWTQLDGVMGNDVSWPQLLDKMSAPAPKGLKLTSITASVDDPNSTTGASTGDTTGLTVADQVGSLTLSGTASTWRQVAAYVHGLSRIKGFTAVNPSTVSNGTAGPGTAKGGGLTFTVTLDLTDPVLSGRYTSTAQSASTTGTTPTTQTTQSGTSTAPTSTSSSSSSSSTTTSTSRSGGGTPKGGTSGTNGSSSITGSITSSKGASHHSSSTSTKHHRKAGRHHGGALQSTQEAS
ncbi:PilN domain-containing protein [Jatrophihabitans endophyticus]|uniref:PilN domain-containing protein n=1 Tax=Jatrophihabitans endophyticus TaxID=1206085 RepID=UPI001A08B391|nr:PilN domain-containing protein [Jatrophihabitans endophyticus]MBE7190224.1 PilN domain-containing protein [Jatrophihabitans endophyticus]